MDGKKKKSKKAKSPTPEEEYVVESIRDKKIEGGEVHYFIKWKDWPEETNTWEPVKNLKGCSDLVVAFEKEREKGGDSSGAKDKKKAKKRKEPVVVSNSDSEGHKSDDAVSDVDEKDKMGVGGENTIDVDVLEELPPGKIPEELLGVVPITGIMTYLVKWKPPVDGLAVANGDGETEEEPDMCLVKGEVFKAVYPYPVIDFYERNISWLRDMRTDEERTADMADNILLAKQNAMKEAEKLKVKASTASNGKKRRLNDDQEVSMSSGNESDSSGSDAAYVPDPILNTDDD